MPVDPFQFFLGLGLLMIALELIIPGLVVVFLGGAALVVAAALYAGIVAGWMPAFTLWFIASLVMVLGVRSAFTRFLPGSSVRQLTDEDLAAFGEEVDVVETVTTRPGGRIRFRGSTWAAQTVQEELLVGQRARLVARENLVWIVEPLDGWAALSEAPRRRLPASSQNKETS